MTHDQFPRQPTLSSDLVLLRPLRADDWAALYAVAADPLLWELHPARDRWQEAVFRRFFDEALESGGALVAIDRAEDRVIGSSRYDVGSARANEVEIGWTFLSRAYWGGAFNGAIKRLMLDHAFRYVDRVLFRIGENNLRSRRAIEKLGAALTDREQIIAVSGRPTRYVIYAIERSASGVSGT